MKEVKINYTKQGYSYVKCTRKDCYNWGGEGICDNCGKDMGEVYLIYILNSAICKSCFEEWQNRAKRYEEDLQLQEQRHIAWYEAFGFKVEDR